MTAQYGIGDASYQAAGGYQGLVTLAEDFYDAMSTLPEAKQILDMHPKDLTESKDKLARFLCGWLGGENRYIEKYGRINIPSAHMHLPIESEDRDAWLLCMKHALTKQSYAPEFKAYLLEQLSIPAERIRQVCGHAR